MIEERTAKRRETILVVDDDPKVHPPVAFHLEGVVERIIYAESAVAGLSEARRNRPDLILLDIDMPKMDGIAVCRALKEDEATRDIPVVFLTGDCEQHQIARALDSGGMDYVTKPFEVIILQARVRAALRTKRLIDLLKGKAKLDPQTGLWNRAAFKERLDALSAESDGARFALVVIDLDHFSRVIAVNGPGVGDEVLREVGEALQVPGNLESTGYRLRRDECAILVAHANKTAVNLAVSTIFEEIRGIRVTSGEGIEIKVTCSAGIVCVSSGDPINRGELLARADVALRVAKDGGGDQWVIES